MFLKVLQNSQENICAWVSFLIKLHTSSQQLYEHETLAQSCDFCETFKSTVFFFQKTSGQLLLFVTDRCNTFTDVSEQVASELWKYFVKNTYGIINAYNSKIQKRKNYCIENGKTIFFNLRVHRIKNLLPPKKNQKKTGEYKIISSMWNLDCSRETLVFEKCI